MGKWIGCLLAVAVILTSCVKKSEPREVATGNEKLFAKQMAPLLDGMGDQHFRVSLEDTLATRYFDQAIILTYGFNHKEAERSFRQVARLEPENPMAWWGVALVQGPNLNLAMQPETVPVAWEALQKAQELKANGTQREQDYIDALAVRYAENPPEDRTSLDQAYADAMEKLAKKYPNDLDAQVLYSEAMMDLHPWDFWTKEGEAKPWTPKILATLESVIERNPDHPMANHLYIHATEASPNPEKALQSAGRLANAVPGAGHLVHMPAHIYIRVGKYHEGTMANERAVDADNEYLAQAERQGIYPLGYVPHNHHFLWATATMEGREKRSIEAAKSTSDLVDKKMMRQPGFGTLQHYWVIPLYGYVRFGKWDEILAYPKPDDDLIYPMGVWHYARGMAYLGTDQREKAKTELDALKVIAADNTLKNITIWEVNTTQELMQIASHVLEGEVAADDGDFDRSIEMLHEALATEDRLTYNEPPDWFFPVRHNLGAVLLAADRPADAETVYQQDLKKFPDNGWALFGLQQSLRVQKRMDEAADVKARFDKAWQHADIELKSSRIL